MPVNFLLGPTMTRFRWVPSSKRELQSAEKKVLSLLDKPYETFDVRIGRAGDIENCKLHYIKVASKTQNTKNSPLVLLHGFGCGSALFAPNLEVLSEKRDVYALDMLGFGLSSRARLSSDAMRAENEVVDSIEIWRQKLNLNRFVLLGHSLGGFVSSAYALSHPERIRHLILEECWGFDAYDPKSRSKLPLWTRMVFEAFSYINLLSSVRAAGPYGFNVLKKALRHPRQYMIEYYPNDFDTIPEYIYHCNVRRPTGEEFFRNISRKFNYTKFPMVNRLHTLPSELGVTMIYGSHTFLPRTSAASLQRQRGKDNTKVYVIQDAGHAVHLEKPHEFNNIVVEALEQIGEN